MRINKYIAKAGLASRRKSEEYIKKGLVFVNGKKLEDLSYQVKEDDQVEVMGKLLEIKEKFYYKLNKPIGFISSNYDPHNKKDLNSLIKIDQRFFCAGRLDKDSHGLMLITNDGKITNKLIHPSKKIEKTYIVKVDKLLTKDDEALFRKGIKLSENEKTSDAKISLLDKKERTYQVVIHQGYNRQVRRMFLHFGSNVIDLKRIKIGQIELGNLSNGKYKKLDKKELEYLGSL
ncbi:pseudouridine synthase [Anaerococcus hydrogenalis]|uniref:Pseudouridine synthase n=1 Tax=Anaerococcus hydrogenalis TaxID=33029 RepID=A0A2N6ULH2_9FIRM|nr:pseudouridine synthase [Anaerococcus hydrogenalis]MDK7694633.1 pseudouridine synthase [Anaerococcus hydrogenalis]MDK7696411.1 pseudouridine synthase [Anaerococcus hydrogenalis]MDK7707660.1 pseudouridine synthase [Anaerococcus hydrogenalis]PMC82671.1 rRNA pseudouridine synthase [Anaerococcus hydrogenalis]